MTRLDEPLLARQLDGIVNRDLDLGPVGEHIGISRDDNAFAREWFSRIEPVEIIRSEIRKNIVVGGAPAQQRDHDDEHNGEGGAPRPRDVLMGEDGNRIHNDAPQVDLETFFVLLSTHPWVTESVICQAASFFYSDNDSQFTIVNWSKK
jgi:hypothetical protein